MIRNPRRNFILCSALAVALSVGVGAAVASRGDEPSERAARSADSKTRKEEEKASVKRSRAYAHLMRAWFEVRRGDDKAVANEVRHAIELQPDSPELKIQAANLLLWVGHTEDAERVAGEALKDRPDHPPALRFLADLAAARALSPSPDEPSREVALALYERLRDQGEVDDTLLQNLLNLRLSAGDIDGATDAVRELVERRPGDRRAMRMLIRLLLDQEKNEEALGVLLPYVAAHPDDELLVGAADEMVRQFDAWDQVESLLSSNPDALKNASPAARQLYGEALLRMSRIDEATVVLEEALAADPANRSVAVSLAQAYRTTGRLADAAALFRRVVDEDPADAFAHYWLGETFRDQGDRNRALVAFHSALGVLLTRHEPQAAGMRDRIRRQMALLVLADDNVEAAGSLVKSLEQPDEPDNLDVRARVALSSESWNEAAGQIAALRKLGEEGYASLLDGERLARTGDWDASATHFRDAVEALGPIARVRASEVYQELGRSPIGEQLLREWTALEPDQPEAWFQLGFYLQRDKQPEAADRAMRKAFEIDSDHAASLNFVGYTLAERNTRLDEALSLIQRAVELDPWNGAFLDSLGWVYYQMGRYEEAREPLEQAAREHPMDPTVLEHLGDLYHSLGDHDLAKATWNRALAAEPEDPRVLETKIESLQKPEGGLGMMDQPTDSESVEQRFVPDEPPLIP